MNKSNCDLMFVSPHVEFEGKERLEALYEKFPGLKDRIAYREGTDGLPRWVVHTGFFDKSGLIKFRDFLNYKKSSFDFAQSLA